MCSFKNCGGGGEGSNVPQIIFVIRDRVTGQRWTFPATSSLVICDTCKPTIQKPEDILDDGGAKIIAGLLQMRPSAEHVSTTIGWTTVDSEDWKKLQSMRSS